MAFKMSGKVYVKLNVDENSQKPCQCGIRGSPTILLFKDRK
jgi:thioredoxin-like negative regulator of GroEL